MRHVPLFRTGLMAVGLVSILLISSATLVTATPNLMEATQENRLGQQLPTSIQQSATATEGTCQRILDSSIIIVENDTGAADEDERIVVVTGAEMPQPPRA